MTVVKFWQNKGTEEGFCSISSEIVTDVTNCPNFYIGRSADVGDMLLHGQVVSECHAQIFCLQGKQNISVSYVNGGWVRVWERGSVRDNEQSLCFIIIQLEFVWCHPCLYIWNAILHALDWGAYLIWTAGIVQLGIICERLVRYGVSSNECSQRFCVQNK